MLNQQTIEKLHALKLIGMAEAFQDQLSQPDIGRLSCEERFGLIVDRQWTWKEDCRMQRYLKLFFYSNLLCCVCNVLILFDRSLKNR
jgi:hypothetical protein